MKRKTFALIFIILSLLLVSCKNNEEIKYIVTFDTDGGRYIASKEVLKGDLVERPEDPSKVDYTFDDWYKDSEFKEKWLLLHF